MNKKNITTTVIVLGMVMLIMIPNTLTSEIKERKSEHKFIPANYRPISMQEWLFNPVVELYCGEVYACVDLSENLPENSIAITGRDYRVKLKGLFCLGMDIIVDYFLHIINNNNNDEVTLEIYFRYEDTYTEILRNTKVVQGKFRGSPHRVINTEDLMSRGYKIYAIEAVLYLNGAIVDQKTFVGRLYLI